MYKIVILDICALSIIFLGCEDRTLLCELFLCRKYRYCRVACKNLTVVPDCLNQSIGPKIYYCYFQLFFAFSSKFLELEIGHSFPRFYAAKIRLGGKHLLNFPYFPH